VLAKVGQSKEEHVYSVGCSSELEQDIVTVSHSHLINEKQRRGFSQLGSHVNHCVLVVLMVACHIMCF